MTSQARSPNSQSGSPSLNSYHTIYYGIATDREGKFDHFNRKIDDSHKDNGYWRFNSRLDEHRAYARGFHTPEDVLRAVNCGDGTYADISLRWQPGQIDTNMQGPRIGSAAQHLKNIYDARYFLGKTLALRGQVPFYPADRRLEGYWVPTLPVSAAPTARPAIITTAGPASSPVWSARVSSPVVAATAKPQQAPSGSPLPPSSVPSLFPNTFTNATTVSSLAQNPSQTPYRVTDSPQTTHKNSMPFLSSHMPTLIAPCPSPTSAQDPLGRNPAESLSSPQAFIAQPHSSALYARRSQSGTSQSVQGSQAARGQKRSTAHPMPFQDRNPVPSARPAQGPPMPLLQQNPGSFQPVVQEVHSSQLGSIASRQYSSPCGALSGPSYRSPYGDSTPPSSPLPTGSSIPPCSAMNRMPSSRRQDSVVTAQIQTDSQAPVPGDDMYQLPYKKTASVDPHSAGRPQSPSTINTPTHTPEHSVGGSEGPTLIVREVTPNTSDVESPSTTCNNHTTATHHERPILPNTVLQDRQVGSLKRPIEVHQYVTRQNKKPKGGTHYNDMHTPLSKQIQFPQSTTDMYQGLPCMDCGEDVGHKSDCHVGNLKPMEHLTVLDYRTFSDSVQYFDPGPWTDHQGPPPEPDPEDPEDQLQGMADIIRNEECYKNDTGLHSLPDDIMITLWALKTCSNTEIVCDFVSDSGIGESEPE